MLDRSHSVLFFNDVPAHVVCQWRNVKLLPRHLHGLRQLQGTKLKRSSTGTHSPPDTSVRRPSDLVSLFAAKGNQHFDSCPSLSITLFSMADTVNSGSNGIMELLEQKDEENAKLRARVAELEDMIMKLSEDVRSLTAELELAVSKFSSSSQCQERYTTTN